MYRTSIILCIVLFILSVGLKGQEKTEVKQISFSYVCFQNPDKTWGYDIYSSGKLLIHQPTIPVMEGLKGFSNKKTASKIAEVVVDKLKKNPNEFPSISMEELNKQINKNL